MNGTRSLAAVLLLLTAASSLAQEHVLATLDGREFPQAASRLALVVWSENYRKLSPVENAESDGERISRKLHELEFDFVRVIPDAASADEILDGVAELKNQIAASIRPVVVIFFFAGHGFQVEGDNFLVPTSASNESTSKLVEDSVSLTEISRRLNPARDASMLLLLLDSCRTIRFLENGNLKDVALREDLQSGFVEGNLLAPALVSMAAAPRNPARSVSRFEGGKNSPYTTALASKIGNEGQSLATLLEATRRQVSQDTDGSQRPTWFNGASSSTFFFRPRDVELEADARAWRVVRSRYDNLRGCAQDYLLTFPVGLFAAQAEYLLSIVESPGEYCSVT
jgi:uncharacterized caspase-like protein